MDSKIELDSNKEVCLSQLNTLPKNGSFLIVQNICLHWVKVGGKPERKQATRIKSLSFLLSVEIHW